MSEVKRPTLLTVLAVLAIIGGVFSCIGAILVLIGIAAIFATGAGSGIAILISGIISCAVGIYGLLAGIKVMGNKPKCLEMMKYFAIGSIAANILTTISYKIAGLPISWGGLIVGLAIGGAILAYIMTNKEVQEWGNSLS